MNIPDDRVLQLTQQILELGDVKIDGHPVSASKVPIQPIVHGSCMVHGCMAEQGEGICCIEPGSSIILFVQPFPQYLIKVGYGCGGVGWLSSLY